MKTAFTPLAERMRPKNLRDYVGQQHLLSPNKPIRAALDHGHLHSMILWGPPGIGKTTLAMLLCANVDADVQRISAVLAGVKDIRAIVDVAKLKREQGITSVLFVDEVHRFNKSQQDAFLPHVESGVITLIGATTENPSFHLNNALLSRARVYVLRPLSEQDLLTLARRVLTDHESGLGSLQLKIADEQLQRVIAYCDGDARALLNILEMLGDFCVKRSKVSDDILNEILSHALRRFDNHADIFYDQISALHKSVRGTDVDAALYWLARMLDGGCDPYYIARRVLRMASEDIGNADPRGLQLALNAWQAYERLGSPEGELALAQAVAYLACAPKSNAVYTAFTAAMQTVKQVGNLEVPMHLRNAPTKLMKQLDYAKGYRYAHNETNAYAKGECYFPERLKGTRFYHPVERGLEIKIKQKLESLQQVK